MYTGVAVVCSIVCRELSVWKVCLPQK